MPRRCNLSFRETSLKDQLWEPGPSCMLSWTCERQDFCFVAAVPVDG